MSLHMESTSKCRQCGAMTQGMRFCQSCGCPVDAARMVPWYHRKWFVVVMLILFFPIGLALLWTSPKTSHNGRMVWTILISLAWGLHLFWPGSSSVPASTAGRPVTSVGSTASPAPAAARETPAQTLANIKATATTPKYDDLARDPNSFKGKPVTYTGEVVQVVLSGSAQVLRVNVTQDKYGLWQDTIWVNAPKEVHILEKDIVQFYGTVQGEREYTGLLWSSVRLPEVTAMEVDVITKAGDRK